MTFEQIKRNFDRKLWNKQMVKMAVKKEVITTNQYKEITGEDYIAQSSFSFWKEVNGMTFIIGAIQVSVGVLIADFVKTIILKKQSKR